MPATTEHDEVEVRGVLGHALTLAARCASTPRPEGPGRQLVPRRGSAGAGSPHRQARLCFRTVLPGPARSPPAKDTMLDARSPRSLERLAPLVAVTFVAVVITFNVDALLSTFDGGIAASAATFTLHGLLPYRDYWLLYGPLSGLVLALPTA